jgi:hypothetical protein
LGCAPRLQHYRFSALIGANMYDVIVTTFAALTVFAPTFIGMRARTNANWRKING